MPKRFLDKFLERFERIDKTQSRDYLEELIKENRFLENAVCQLEEGILILDRAGLIKMINPQGELLLGVSGRKLGQRPYDKCPLDREVIKVIRNAILSGKKYISHETLVDFPKEQLMRFVAVPAEEDNELLGWIIEFQDITESKKLDLQKIQTEKLKTLITLAAGIAHELGNPLNSLGIHLELINRELKKLSKKTKDKLAKPLQVARTEIRRLDQIISGFLHATRPLKPRFFLSHVHDVLNETFILLSAELKKNKIKIDKRYHTEIPKIYLDYVEIRQAFINIIKNAAEAMPDGGVLRIATDLKDDRIKILFRDSGIGIPEDKLDKIFEPYYTTKIKGSGLGLMIVHRVVREHGGEIEVKSKLGEGTTVVIALPTGARSPKLLTAAGSSVKCHVSSVK